MLDRYDENLILGYIENELDAADRARFEAMLEQDEPLALLIDQLIADRALLRGLPAKEAPAILMEQVQCELERQMLVDVAPLRVAAAAAKSSVFYRFSSRMRWAGAVAAALLVGAGLTWHFDPMGWSGSSPATINDELAYHKSNGNELDDFSKNAKTLESADSGQPSAAIGERRMTGDDPEAMAKRIKPDAADDDRSGGLSKDSAATGNALALQTTPDAKRDGAGESEAAAAAEMKSEGGKGTAALALAQQDSIASALPVPAPAAVPTPAPAAPVSPTAPGAAAAFGDPVGTAEQPRAELAATASPTAQTPVFQIELQTVSAVETRQWLLAWADQNDASEQPHAAASRSRSLAMTKQSRAESQGDVQSFAADEEQADKVESKEHAKAEAASSSDKKKADLREAEGGAGAGAAPGAAPGKAPGATIKSADGAKRGNIAPPAAAKSSEGASEAKDGARAREDQSPLADAPLVDALLPDAPRALKSKLTGPASIELLVPEDRIDQLVEHIEAKTGQSLIVVREGNQTLLLSPQVANDRAAASANARKQQDKNRDAPVLTEAPADGVADASHKVAAPPAKPAAASELVPAPTTKEAATESQGREKEEKPSAKKAVVRQVMVRILLAEEPK